MMNSYELKLSGGQAGMQDGERYKVQAHRNRVTVLQKERVLWSVKLRNGKNTAAEDSTVAYDSSAKRPRHSSHLRSSQKSNSQDVKLKSTGTGMVELSKP